MFRPTPPIRLTRGPGSYGVHDGNGRVLARIYYREDPQSARIAGVLYRTDAEQVAMTIARAMRDMSEVR